MNKHLFYLTLNILLIAALFSCDNVEDGYRANYNETTADFSVQLTTAERGIEGDTAKFLVHINSNNQIKSILVTSDVSGTNGTGFISDTTQADPLIDHAFGTVQPGTYTIDIEYLYVFPSDTVKTNLSFTLIDEEGKKEIKYSLFGIPKIEKYNNIQLYTNSSKLTDALSTADGRVFPNISDYTEYTSWNLEIQSAFDIVFLVGSTNNAMILSPYNSNLGIDLSNKNKTVFKKLTNFTNNAFDTLTHITLSEITEAYGVKNGSTIIDSVVVGDFIGFRTDFASENPYKYGIIKINAIHPANADYYEGKSYVIDMDVITQN